MHVWTKDYRIGLASTPAARCRSLESPAWVAGLTPPLAYGYSSNGRPLLLLWAASPLRRVNSAAATSRPRVKVNLPARRFRTVPEAAPRQVAACFSHRYSLMTNSWPLP